MLARAPPRSFADSPRCSPGTRKPRAPAVSPLLFSALGHDNSSCSRGRLAARAGVYTRVPMETAGAYQLIDEETSQRVIVWGGADDDPDSPVPSKDVLSWTPKEESPGSRGAGSDENPRERRLVGTVGGFGKLKVQRVKALMRSKKKPVPQVAVGENVFDDNGAGVDMGADPDVDFSAKMAASNGYSGEGSQRSRFLSVLQREQPSPAWAENVRRGGSSASSLRGWKGARSSSAIESDRIDSTSRSKQQRRSMSDNDGRFFSRRTFKELGCSDDMLICLSKLQFHRPSHIQAMTYAHILEGKSCIITDQSGSGKTLAYLAPAIQRLRQDELLGLGKSSSRSPRVLILVPTSELATQVLHNCRLIAKTGIPFRSMVATGGFRQKTQLESLQQEMDVLIATPGRFIFLLQEGFLQLDNLKCVVLDEVLRSLMSSAPVMTQYLFATATLPVDIYNRLIEVFPDCEVIMGPGMHRTSPGLEEVLVDCSGNDGEEKSPDTAFSNKKSALLQLVEETPVPRTVVFCNKIETCRKVENILKRFDRKGHQLKVLPFHAALDQEIRLSNMKEFLNSQPKDSMFFICTDRASRGIDFASLDHVILFDFPRDPSEYIRRVGRTARGAGGKGNAFVFVVGKQVSLARRIMERNQKGHPLHDLPSS
ncbi:hypothetical protein Taro_038506 [Colocasia esculenta]|uniref:DEAD-box ATP-dependent RNA helicase 50 n=1 Tax=Colocasia esculenta TaxID=4460 RepID=A0A843W3N8_COLES|nr:hypothetical protein [Colocasia esculenta]